MPPHHLLSNTSFLLAISFWTFPHMRDASLMADMCQSPDILWMNLSRLSLLSNRGIHSPLALGLWQIMKTDCENGLLQTISLLNTKTWVPQQIHRLLDRLWSTGLSPRDACVMLTLKPNLPKFKLCYWYLTTYPIVKVRNRQKMLDATHSHPQSIWVKFFLWNWTHKMHINEIMTTYLIGWYNTFSETVHTLTTKPNNPQSTSA